MTEYSHFKGEDLKTTTLAQVSLVEDSTTASSTAKSSKTFGEWRYLYLELPDGLNQLAIEGKRSNDDQKSGILLDDIHLWSCGGEGTYVYAESVCN